jgi:hypothetical protein
MLHGRQKEPARPLVKLDSGWRAVGWERWKHMFTDYARIRTLPTYAGQAHRRVVLAFVLLIRRGPGHREGNP